MGGPCWLRRLERRTAGVRDAAYRLVGSNVRSMLWDVLAAVVAGLLVTQLSTAVTTVYLHRTPRAPGPHDASRGRRARAGS